MISYTEAIALVLNNVRKLPPVELPLAEAGGRVLAEEVCSLLDLPPLDNSAMDGYAFACAGVGEGLSLREVGFIPAGDTYSGPVAAGEAVRIMTGAPLPAGCDTVVPIEDVELQLDRLRLKKAPQPGDHVRYRSEELKAGETVLSAGTTLVSGAIGLLAAAGIEQVKVYPAPQVAILSTGDELIELGELPAGGKIVNSNSYLLAARLREEGYQPLLLGIARDRPGELEAHLKQGLQTDLLLTTGGVSVGDRDHVQEALGHLGFMKKFWKVAIKPGKPLLFGHIGQLPVFGLPGNPAASAATFELFVRPALRKLSGCPDPLAPRIRVMLAEPVRGGGKRQQFLWGQLRIEAGQLSFVPSGRQGSGQNRSLQGAQALLPVAIGSPDLAAGDEVEIILLRLPPGQDLPVIMKE